MNGNKKESSNVNTKSNQSSNLNSKANQSSNQKGNKIKIKSRIQWHI